MKDKNPPAFQFYAADWLSNLDVQLLSTKEEGIYIRLLSYCWKEGSLPGDSLAIAQLCKRDISEQEILKVLELFYSKNGRFFHKRLERERQRQLEFKQERSKSGTLGAKKRWDNQRSSAIGSAIAQPMAQRMAKNSSSSSTSTSIKEGARGSVGTPARPEHKIYTGNPDANHKKISPEILKLSEKIFLPD